MRLLELFGGTPPDILDELRANVLDILTALVARGVTEVTVKEVEDDLKKLDIGIRVSRSLVMDILNPNDLKIVKSIEGDTIVLNSPKKVGSEEESAKREEDAKREEEKRKKEASKQAKKELEKKSKPIAKPKDSKKPKPKFDISM